MLAFQIASELVAPIAGMLIVASIENSKRLSHTDAQTCRAVHAACAAVAKTGVRHWSGRRSRLEGASWERGSKDAAAAVRYSGWSNMAAKDSLQGS